MITELRFRKINGKMMLEYLDQFGEWNIVPTVDGDYVK